MALLAALFLAGCDEVVSRQPGQAREEARLVSFPSNFRPQVKQRPV